MSGKDSVSRAFEAIEKAFGRGAIRMMDDEKTEKVGTFPSGSLGLDIALGVGGYPRGRMVEIFGPEASGKTTLTLAAIAELQRIGGTAAFIDAEHALDPTYAQALGVDLGSLLLAQPDSGEQALEIAEILIREGSVDLVVIDSVAALVPKAEIDGDMGDQHVGLQARLMSQALRKLTAICYKHACAECSHWNHHSHIRVLLRSPTCACRTLTPNERSRNPGRCRVVRRSAAETEQCSHAIEWITTKPPPVTNVPSLYRSPLPRAGG